MYSLDQSGYLTQLWTMVHLWMNHCDLYLLNIVLFHNYVQEADGILSGNLAQPWKMPYKLKVSCENHQKNLFLWPMASMAILEKPEDFPIKSQSLMEKLTASIAIFKSYVRNYQRVSDVFLIFQLVYFYDHLQQPCQSLPEALPILNTYPLVISHSY